MPGKGELSHQATYVKKVVFFTYVCLSLLQLEIPKELISSEQMQGLKSQLCPSFIPVDQEKKITKVYDEDTRIIQRRLSNGIPVNYRVNDFYVHN